MDCDINFRKELDNEQYDALFEGRMIRRAKFEKFKGNVAAVANNLTSDE